MALMDVANRVSDTLSLDVLFQRLMDVVTETLNVERSSLFLYDRDTDELFSRVTQGNAIGEIRFPSDRGIAGSVFTSGSPEIIGDAYADSRFIRQVDADTGYRTRNILCVPIRNKQGIVIGVTQALNKRDGEFDDDDRHLLESLSSQAAAAFENAQLFERMERSKKEEALLLDTVSSITSELLLKPLLERILSAAMQLLGADRGSLFLYDPATDELWSRVADDQTGGEIRFPAFAGIAGECFVTGRPVVIDDAYTDPRFNPEVDRGTGFRTTNILCVPIMTKTGNKIGVMEILNKRDGPFSAGDRRRLEALCAQAAVAIENAQLFDEVSQSRNYNESILRSMSNGVLTLGPDKRVNKVNDSALRILARDEQAILDRPVSELFSSANSWVTHSLDKVVRTGRTDVTVDSDLVLDGGAVVSVNMTAVPLQGAKSGKCIGSMLDMEDVTQEKRLRNTMSSYMSKAVVDELLDGGEAALRGSSREVSVLFSDIRGFTAMSERIGARETVAMLNEYFTEMVDIVFAHHGILEKYIGDMIMAVFGSVRSTENDAMNAVMVGTKMMRALRMLNQRRQADGREPIDVGIGVSTGEVVAGSIGSPRRLEYTVVGDRVNLAERLQNANKYYGTDILVCELTAQRLQKPVVARELDLIRVRGMQRPVAIWELLDHHTPESFPRMDDVRAEFSRGLALYRARDWRNAADAFREALKAYPGDKPSELYVTRCEAYSAPPPPGDWDGVWSLRQD
jgi:adenylate cyclase